MFAQPAVARCGGNDAPRALASAVLLQEDLGVREALLHSTPTFSNSSRPFAKTEPFLPHWAGPCVTLRHNALGLAVETSSNLQPLCPFDALFLSKLRANQTASYWQRIFISFST